jgi:hypothetical protein
MIAVSSKGQSFRALARYLAAGRSGEERERVEWSAGRNLPTADPELASVFMRATAEQNVRVERPVYHLVLSFDPGDAVDRGTMEQIADRVLEQLGLSEHQAVVVAHGDRAHPHVHVLANRVHPETGRVWDLAFDYRAIQEVLRVEERARGMREVPGTLFQLPDQEPPEIAVIAGGERRRAERLGTEPLLERVRQLRDVLSEASSWPELEARLAVEGMWLERRGRGLVVTDGGSSVRASRVGPELSLTRLEARFGVSYADRLVYDVTRQEPCPKGIERTQMFDDVPVGLVPLKPILGPGWMSPTVRAIAHDLRTRATVEVVAAEHYRAGIEASAAQARVAQLEFAQARVLAAEAALLEALQPAFHEPERAVSALRQLARTEGDDAALSVLHTRPEILGTMRKVEEDRAFGLVRRDNDSAARAAAGLAAGQGRALLDAERALHMTVAEARVRRLEEAFEHALRRLYREPARAVEEFRECAERNGVDNTAKALETRPMAFGPVRVDIAIDSPRTAAVMTARAQTAARLGVEFVEARRLVRAEVWRPDAGEAASAVATERVGSRSAAARARDRQQRTAQRLQRLPRVSLLERGIAAGMRRITPAELEQLRRAVTMPQLALATRLRATVRESVLGREGVEP